MSENEILARGIVTGIVIVINIGKLMAVPFLLVWDLATTIWDLLTESPEEAEEREHRMLHDENMFGR